MAKLAGLELKVDGMVRRGGIVWMGCPDSIREALEGLQGIEGVEYDIEGDLFRVRYRPSEVGPDRIQEVIVGLGREKGLPYRVAVLWEKQISWGSEVHSQAQGPTAKGRGAKRNGSRA